MKRILQIVLMATTMTLTAQTYEFSVVSDYNNTGDTYEMTFVATPDFTNASPNFADMQVSFAITAGN
ncbi:hypothetical protein, partial [Winogradskyella sp. 3972H.M.0a.05]|uniref:hypothetical protein n=1 Tax=Winogradskyella sp. 3972H.M.0a.05 TaxID=2950277 RepID=UPI0033924FD4